MIEQSLQIPIGIIAYGPERNQIVWRKKYFWFRENLFKRKKVGNYDEASKTLVTATGGLSGYLATIATIDLNNEQATKITPFAKRYHAVIKDPPLVSGGHIYTLVGSDGQTKDAEYKFKILKIPRHYGR